MWDSTSSFFFRWRTFSLGLVNVGFSQGGRREGLLAYILACVSLITYVAICHLRISAEVAVKMYGPFFNQMIFFFFFSNYFLIAEF